MAQEHEAGLVICVTGPESTGKTTLARALAAELGVPLVEEAARARLSPSIGRDPRGTGSNGRYLGGSDLPIAIPPGVDRGQEAAPTGPGQRYTREDVLEIARAQLTAETSALATGARIVVADTDLTVIQVWWEEKYGELDPWLTEALGDLGPRRYLLTVPDIPWEPDPLRESPLDRERLLGRYRSILAELAFPHAEIGGAGTIRFERAWEAVSVWLSEWSVQESVPGAR